MKLSVKFYKNNFNNNYYNFDARPINPSVYLALEDISNKIGRYLRPLIPSVKFINECNFTIEDFNDRMYFELFLNREIDIEI